MNLFRARFLFSFLWAVWLCVTPRGRAAQTIPCDVCVFGATSAGVAAAVQAAREGRKVVLTEFGGHVGGLTAGGLSQTDIGNKDAIGGLA
ncbi:MAG TPA: FAD-dependent oxidoreductase, partial [Candidatus Cybelea sp.]|nr:FAD-dependent oxidoreductase [Candidatus Cybelea sp.]